MRFNVNGVNWKVIFVTPDSSVLIDRTGKRTIACTDPVTKRIYISNTLHGPMLKTVLRHELCHCVLVSYDLLGDLHRMIDRGDYISVEEFICNVIADHYAEFRI